MKKSTLITTIAMIVVVVVALSTATYAWFASSSTSTATMTITSNATSGWSLSKGTITGTNVTWSSQSTTLDLGDALAGLYSPNGVLTLAPNANTATAVTVNKSTENFYACNTYNGNAYVTSASTAKDPTVVRIVNGNEGEAQCTVTILVVLETDNANSRYAAAGLTFYFADGAGKTYTLGYDYEDASEYKAENPVGSKKAYTDVDQLKNAQKGDILAHTSTNNVAGEGITGNIPEYDKATLAGNTNSKITFRKNGDTAITAADQTTLVPANATFLAYTFTTEQIQSGSGVNFATYAWIDGWKAEDSARGSTISILYSFGGALTLPDTAAEAV